MMAHVTSRHTAVPANWARISETPWPLITVAPFTEPEPPTLESSSAQIRAWVFYCDQRHGHFDSQKQDDDIPKLPTRLVDVGNASTPPRLHISSNGQSGRYLALSHCWGSPEHMRAKTTRANLNDHVDKLDFAMLPRTFQDAIMVARSLDIPYIWIDSLCIIQDSRDDWALEASRMAQVYSGAYLTLAADYAANPTQGLFASPRVCPRPRSFIQVDMAGNPHTIHVRRDRPDRPIDRKREMTWSCYSSESVSELNGRAWALQERILSHRTVSFTNTELIWECRQEGIRCSCGHDITEPFDGRTAFERLSYMTLSFGNLPAIDHELGRLWAAIVQDLASRRLTFAADRLPAMAGVASALPFPTSDYLAGLWKRVLRSTLLWTAPNARHNEPLETPPNARVSAAGAPTWSWACLSVPVMFPCGKKQLEIDWVIHDCVCTPSTPNPDGPVSDGLLHVEGVLLPVSLSQKDEFKVDICVPVHNGDPGDSGSMAKPRGGATTLYFDAGMGGCEWKRPGSSYAPLVAAYLKLEFLEGLQGRHRDTPIALILRQDTDGRKTTCWTRIGLAVLDSMEGEVVRKVGRQRVVIV